MSKSYSECLIFRHLINNIVQFICCIEINSVCQTEHFCQTKCKAQNVIIKQAHILAEDIEQIAKYVYNPYDNKVTEEMARVQNMLAQ